MFVLIQHTHKRVPFSTAGKCSSSMRELLFFFAMASSDLIDGSQEFFRARLPDTDPDGYANLRSGSYSNPERLAREPVRNLGADDMSGVRLCHFFGHGRCRSSRRCAFLHVHPETGEIAPSKASQRRPNVFGSMTNALRAFISFHFSLPFDAWSGANCSGNDNGRFPRVLFQPRPRARNCYVGDVTPVNLPTLVLDLISSFLGYQRRATPCRPYTTRIGSPIMENGGRIVSVWVQSLPVSDYVWGIHRARALPPIPFVTSVEIYDSGAFATARRDRETGAYIFFHNTSLEAGLNIMITGVLRPSLDKSPKGVFLVQEPPQSSSFNRGCCVQCLVPGIALSQRVCRQLMSREIEVPPGAIGHVVGRSVHHEVIAHSGAIYIQKFMFHYESLSTYLASMLGREQVFPNLV